MNIELTQEELAEIRTALLDKLREVKTMLNFTIFHPVGEPTLKRWLYRKDLLMILLDKLEDIEDES